MHDMMHVYKIPEKRSAGYCFNGGNPIEFLNVDWVSSPEVDTTVEDIRGFFEQKLWFTKTPLGTRFLVLCDARPELTFQMVRT